MENISIGYCTGCDKPVVYLKWREERVVIAVGCKDCGHEIIFDLEAMYSALVDEEMTQEQKYEKLLREFVPKGKPS